LKNLHNYFFSIYSMVWALMCATQVLDASLNGLTVRELAKTTFHLSHMFLHAVLLTVSRWPIFKPQNSKRLRKNALCLRNFAA
jgi:hypothetical protein